PCRKRSGECDLPFADGVEAQAYGAAIGEALPSLLDRFKPELVLYNAGVDPHRDDRLGRLCLSDLGLLQRDHLVFDACLRLQIPVASVIGGGYDALAPLVKRHALVFRAATDQARLHGL
ncbi:MAG: histone deacetylase, partial [Synechococcales cyanobacterium H12SWP_bin.12]|nr:histone deacetylase [Synechococcales cyanobacterium H12SWP_bin.12]